MQHGDILRHLQLLVYSSQAPHRRNSITDRAEAMPKPKRQRTVVNNYTGYTVEEGATVDEVKEFPSDNAAAWFFDSYVNPRKPAKVVCNCPIDISRFKAGKLADTLHYEGDLQIERKHNSGFGSGLQREHMKLPEVLNVLMAGDDSYYLTTQYEEAGVDLGQDEEKEELDLVDRDLGLEIEKRPEEDELESESEEVKVTAEDDLESEREGPGFQDFSDVSSLGSIDPNDLHDDFEDDFEDEDEDQDPDVDEINSRIKGLLQPPLSNLYRDKTFPLVPSWLSTLIPQQINLWMGSSSKQAELKFSDELSLENIGKAIPGNGNSSGLHHDHADNLYILVEGSKRFTLYSPSDSLKLFTVGQIFKVFENGLIDYEINLFAANWKHLRNDGAMLADIAAWKLSNEDYSTMSKKELMAIANDYNDAASTTASTGRDPPSFSKVPPLLLHLNEVENNAKLLQFAEEYFPGLLQLNKLEVWLKPGDMLYLPAGWFHEVSSFTDGGDTSVHTAINYWFIPPTESCFDQPYQDDFWTQDFNLTLEAIKLAEQGRIKFNY